MSKEQIIINLYAISPLLLSAAGAIIILAVSVSNKTGGIKKRLETCESIAFTALLTAMCLSSIQIFKMIAPQKLFSSAVCFDSYSAVSAILFSLMGIITLFISDGDNANIGGKYKCEYYAALLFAFIGANIMAMANDLLVALIGIEILSVSTYIMIAFNFQNSRGAEGGLKYFITGAAASAMYIFGLAHIYGGTKSVYLDVITSTCTAGGPDVSYPALIIGALFLISALLVKIAAVPFRIAIDVYDASGVSVAAFMTYFVKAAGFILIYRIFAGAFSSITIYINGALIIFSVITMSIANIAALFQTNFKRMLAYSSVSHTAYALLAIIAIGGAKNSESVILSGAYMLFYLTAYFFTNAAIFSSLNCISPMVPEIHTINDFTGLGFKRPYYCAAFSFALLSLAAMPSTSGFIANFMIFYGAFAANFRAVILIAVINNFIAFYYYMKIIMKMYMQKNECVEPAPVEISSGGSDPSFCLAISTFMILFMGIYPEPFIKFFKFAVSASFSK